MRKEKDLFRGGKKQKEFIDIFRQKYREETGAKLSRPAAGNLLAKCLEEAQVLEEFSFLPIKSKRQKKRKVILDLK